MQTKLTSLESDLDRRLKEKLIQWAKDGHDLCAMGGMSKGKAMILTLHSVMWLSVAIFKQVDMNKDQVKQLIDMIWDIDCSTDKQKD